jgi:hypothetical protein
MCTIIPRYLKNRPKTAKKDIVVYKGGYIYDLSKKSFITPYMDFIYEKDILYKEELTYDSHDLAGYDDVEGAYRICLPHPLAVVKGFHSLSTLDKKRLNGYRYDRIFGEFVIPKGSKYFINPCGNVVSNQIVFKKFL